MVPLAAIPQVHAGMMTMDLACNGDGQSWEKDGTQSAHMLMENFSRKMIFMLVKLVMEVICAEQKGLLN